MTPTWYVVKYMPDLTRREPRNVGVVVTDGETIDARFLGERDGRLNLNRVPRWIPSRRTYRTWVRYWRSVIAETTPQQLAEALVPVPDGNYLIELGGVELTQGPPRPLRVLADELFQQLVLTMRSDADSDRADLDKLCQEALLPFKARTKYRVFDGVHVPVAIDGGYQDPLRFHYAVQNGKWNYLRRIHLADAGDSTWDRVHAARATFLRLDEHPDSAHRHAGRLTLILGEPTNDGFEAQAAVLAEQSEVVEVEDPAAAADTLTDIIG